MGTNKALAYLQGLTILLNMIDKSYFKNFVERPGFIDNHSGLITYKLMELVGLLQMNVISD